MSKRYKPTRTPTRTPILRNAAELHTPPARVCWPAAPGVAEKAVQLEQAPDEPRLTVAGAVSHYIEPDPYSGWYGIGRGQDTPPDTIPIEPLARLDACSLVYSWSSILPACGRAIARNVERQSFLVEETIDVSDATPPDLRRLLRRERHRLQAFVRHAFGSEDTWRSALEKARRDLEGCGWRALEVLRALPPHLQVDDATAGADGPERSQAGLLAAARPPLPALKTAAVPVDFAEVDCRGPVVGLRHIEAETLRWCPASAPLLSPVWRLVDGDEDDADEQKVSGIPVPHYEKAYEMRAWRLILHERNGEMVYFQELGDPRIIDSATGEQIGRFDQEQWPDLQQHPLSSWANELFSDLTPDPTWSPYGAPWWWGVQEFVLGLMAAEAAIRGDIESPQIPRVIITAIGTAAAKHLERQAEKAKKDNQDKPERVNGILYLEGTPPGDIEFDDSVKASPLGVHQIHVLPDDLYGTYIDRARKIIRGTKGLSNKALGESEDDSYASADASLIMDDHQVYGPERSRNEEWLDRLWQAMRIRFHRLKLVAPKIMSSEQKREWLTTMQQVGADTPEISRRVASKELGLSIPQIQGAWGDRPWGLTLLEAQAGGGVDEDGAAPASGALGSTGGPRPAASSAASTAPDRGRGAGDAPGAEEGRAEKSAGAAAGPQVRMVAALEALKSALAAQVELERAAGRGA
ncbi:MAG: hypothetical protein FJ125_09015, partial [Deltaproteobacteria bacterium]|nr:hypothetical protein [Deltaproteobacteria bacterium]